MNAIADAKTTSVAPDAGSPARPSLIGAIGGEALKLRRQGWIWAMLALAVVFFVLVSVALLQAGNMRAVLEKAPATFLFDLYDIYQSIFDTGAGIFLLIVSARLVGMEFTGGTIRVLLGRGAGRLRLLFAKLAALLLLGLALLAGFLILTVAAVYLSVVSWEGSASRLASLPAHVWTDLWISILIAIASIVAAVLIGSTAALLGRSLAFGLAAALAFFPADNLLTIVSMLLHQLTHQHLFLDFTTYLLGPTLNALPHVLETDREGRAAFATPLLAVSATHAGLVVLGWMVGMLVVTIAVLRSRDVLE